jgi:transitional endoplasmic reticulum ATPase
MLSQWVGESERTIREVFKIARLSSPCIVFFDELEAIAGIRGGGENNNVSERVISQLLSEMDGIEELRGVVVMAATNRPDLLDTALLRAGRFEVRLDLPEPDLAARRKVFEVHSRNKPLADDVSLDKLAEDSQGLNGSDIESVCRRAAMESIRHSVEAGGTPEEMVPKQITAVDFERAIEAVRKLRPTTEPVKDEAPKS